MFVLCLSFVPLFIILLSSIVISSAIFFLSIQYHIDHCWPRDILCWLVTYKSENIFPESTSQIPFEMRIASVPTNTLLAIFDEDSDIVAAMSGILISTSVLWFVEFGIHY